MTRPSDRPRPTVRARVSPERALAERIRATGRTPGQIRAWAEQYDVPTPKAGVDDLVLEAYLEAHPVTAGVARAKTADQRSARTPEHVESLTDAIAAGTIIVCKTRCYACGFGEHRDPPAWHSWAEPDDVEHAKATGQPDPSDSRCACSCADTPRPTPSASTTSTAPASSPSLEAGSVASCAPSTSAPAADPFTVPTGVRLSGEHARTGTVTCNPVRAHITPGVPAEQPLPDAPLRAVLRAGVTVTEALAAGRRLGAAGIPLTRYVARVVELDEHLHRTLALAEPAPCTGCGGQVPAEHIARTGHTVHGNPDTLTGCWPALTGRKTA